MWLLVLNLLFIYSKSVSGGREVPGPVIGRTGVCVKQNANLKQAPYAIYETDSFTEFITKSRMWADKSELATNMIIGCKFILITVPRRWGKSINMGMLNHYYNRPMNERGNPIELKKTAAYSYFIKGRVLLPDGKVLKFRPVPHVFYQRMTTKYHLCQHPVIYFNLTGINATQFFDLIKIKVSWAFAAHTYLLKNWTNIVTSEHTTFLEQKEAKTCKERFMNYLNQQETDKMFVMNSILYLSKWLHKFHDRKVVILLDDYDALINDLYFNDNPQPITKKQVDESLTFFKQFMDSTFKRNTHIMRAIITGTLCVSKSLNMSSWGEFEELNLYNMKDSLAYYGITHWEIFPVMGNERNISDVLRNTAEDGFHGYFTYGCPTQGMLPPWSVAQFINTRILTNYFYQMKVATFAWKLLKHAAFRNVVDSLRYKGNYYRTTYGRIFHLTFEECDILKRLFYDELPFEEKYIGLVMGYLSQMGYFAIDSVYSNYFDCDLNGSVNILIPSTEVECVIDHYLSLYGNLNRTTRSFKKSKTKSITQPASASVATS